MKFDSYNRFLKSELYLECVQCENQDKLLPFEDEVEEDNRRKVNWLNFLILNYQVTAIFLQMFFNKFGRVLVLLLVLHAVVFKCMGLTNIHHFGHYDSGTAESFILILSKLYFIQPFISILRWFKRLEYNYNFFTSLF